MKVLISVDMEGISGVATARYTARAAPRLRHWSAAEDGLTAMNVRRVALVLAGAIVRNERL